MDATVEPPAEPVLRVFQRVHDLSGEWRVELRIADEDVVPSIAGIAVRQKQVAQEAMVVEPDLKILVIRFSSC